MNKKLKQAVNRAVKSLYRALPVLFGALLLVSLANTLIPKTWYESLFRNHLLIDPLIGSALGSVLAGNPITSYVISGELLEQGVSLLAVTAFLVAWVTVGVVQLPAEALILGKRFAVTRNLTAFVLAIIVALITVLVLGIL